MRDMRFLLTVLCALVPFIYAQEDESVVNIKVGNVWGDDRKALQMKGWCVFYLQESREVGEIHVDVQFSKPTRKFQILSNMDVVSRLNKGRDYVLVNNAPFHNTELKIEFMLTFRGKPKRPPKGTCTSNIPPATTMAPTTIPLTSSSPEIMSSSSPEVPSSPPPSSPLPPATTNESPIEVESSWENIEEGGYIMTGVCRFTVNPTLFSYGVMITFNKETSNLTEWEMNVDEQDPSGLWYYLVNRHPEHNSHMDIRFQIQYDSEPHPDGMCTLDIPSDSGVERRKIGRKDFLQNDHLQGSRHSQLRRVFQELFGDQQPWKERRQYGSGKRYRRRFGRHISKQISKRQGRFGSGREIHQDMTLASNYKDTELVE